MLLSKSILKKFCKKTDDSSQQKHIPSSEKTLSHSVTEKKAETTGDQYNERVEKQQSDHKFVFKKFVHALKFVIICIFIFFIIFAALAIMSVIFIWLWHILTPDGDEGWRWLMEDDVTKIQNFVVGGVISNLGVLSFRQVWQYVQDHK